MRKQIDQCLWCNDNAEEVLDYYLKSFPGAELISSSKYPGTDKLLVAELLLYGQRFQLLNGNVNFSMNAATSFMIQLDSEAEVKELHQRLSDEGNILMPLQEYPWSPLYSWVTDKFGTHWQLYTIPKGVQITQTIAPSLMFTGKLAGKAEEAISYYTSIFPDSEVQGILRHPDAADRDAGLVQHAQFVLSGNTFMCMDSSMDHQAAFNESVSFVVTCDTQEEIDHFWESFTRDGAESMCGWCRDKYGISWQIVPAFLGEIMSRGTQTERQKVMQAFMKMRKFDIEELQRALD